MKPTKSKIESEELWRILCNMKNEAYDDYLQNSSEINHFKLRAECESEANQIRMILGIRCLKIVKTIRCFPDTEVELYTTMSLKELRKELRKIFDGHVMVETVALAKDYTGERNYELE